MKKGNNNDGQKGHENESNLHLLVLATFFVIRFIEWIE